MFILPPSHLRARLLSFSNHTMEVVTPCLVPVSSHTSAFYQNTSSRSDMKCMKNIKRELALPVTPYDAIQTRLDIDASVKGH